MSFCALAMLEFLYQFKQLFIALAWGSLTLFIVSLAIIPWLVIKIPADYFHEKRRSTVSSKSKHPMSAQLFAGIKNLFGFGLICLGVLMLVLPGQGILTILIGLFLMNFPGKYKIERKLVSMPKVLNSLNWIRAKADKKPLII